MLNILKEYYGIENDFDMCIINKSDNLHEDVFTDKTNITREVIKADSYIYEKHNISHVACGFYQSPYDECLIVHIDGTGDEGEFNIYHAKDGLFKMLKWFDDMPNVGRRYRLPALSLKEINKFKDDNRLMKQPGLSGQLMDLSLLGDVHEDWIPGFKKLFRTGQVEHVGLYTEVGMVTYRVYRSYCKINKGGLIYKEIEGQLAYDIAATTQAVFEEMITHRVERFVNQYKLPLVVVGGCALNELLINKMRTMFGEVYVPPNPDDGGVILGQIFLKQPPIKRPIIRTIPILDEDEFTYESTTPSEIVELMSEGNIIGIMDGECDLGHTSIEKRIIIADPGKHSKITINNILNKGDYRLVKDIAYIETPTNTLIGAILKEANKKIFAARLEKENCCTPITIRDALEFNIDYVYTNRGLLKNVWKRE